MLGITVITVAVFAAAAAPEDEKLVSFFDRFLEAELTARPYDATRLGDHRFSNRLDDLSPPALAANTERWKKTLAELPKEVEYGKLSRGAQIDFEIFRDELKRRLWIEENEKPYEVNPLLYNELISDSVYLLLTQSSLPMATNVQNARQRMDYIPGVVDAAKKNLKNPPKIYVETAIKRNRGAIAFYSHDIFLLAKETPQTSALARAAAPVLASLKGYQEFLEKDLLPRADGEWRIGTAKFAEKLEFELAAGIPAAELRKQAEAEEVRVRGEMYVIARQLWSGLFPGKALPPDDAAGRRAAIDLVLAKLGKEHGKPSELAADARKTVADVCKFIRERDLLRLPEPDRCQIIEMPEFQRGFSVAYLNPAPALDVKANSFYAVSPPPSDWSAERANSLLEEYNRHMLQILTIHEAYPGHYVQLEYGNRHPSKIRRIFSSGVFAEGWAVYTEQTMLDEGYGAGDLALRLHQLKFYLRAVVNAILDQRMHCDGIDDREAQKMLVERGFQSEGEAVGKVTRAKLSSGQLSTYFAGRMVFYKLRQEVQREQGAEFNLGRYHEAVLDHGTLPPKYLSELVRERLKAPR
ncbi:MAG TPA: DUF885 domain-containing protein [Planctomycetia bacterium]|nr:DUF885 domain-containing protein [Planctomycetia bacterium]